VVCDLLDLAQVRRTIEALAPDVLIHAQALSDVDRCEREPAEAIAQNATTVQHVVSALAGRPTLLVHVSTDYVFDGRKGAAYEEADPPNPVSVYGRSKLEGERQALRHPRAIVVRPSTLFGPGRMNFCDHVVQRLKAGEPVEAFFDQRTSPTYTVDLAEAIEAISRALLERPAEAWPRIVHAANAGGCTRVAFAERVADLLGCSRDLIQRIPMAAQRRPAPRPPCSMLTTTILPSLIGRTLRPWDEALEAYLRRRRFVT
jgi:dTDP-4-dehydrorhamnose reductase